MTLAPMLRQMDTTRATEVKTKGWTTLVRNVRAKKAVLITNRNHPEVVVLDVDAYEKLLGAAQKGASETTRESVLTRLQWQFDGYLASLNESDRLSTLLRAPAPVGKKIKLGPSL